MLSVLQLLMEKFDGNIEATADVFGNVRALTGVLDLMGASAEDNALVFEQMADKTGVLDEALGITADTAAFKFDVAMATARDSLLEIGLAILENVSPRLDDFIKWMEQNGPAIETGFIRIFDAVDKFITSEILANIIQAFADMWPEIEQTIESLGNLVLALSPLLEGTLDNILPMIGDMASIMSDITFFVDETVGSLGDWETDSPGFIKMLELQLNPMLRLKEVLSQLAGLFDRARAAFERFKAAGGLNSVDLSAINTSTLGGRRASGGPVAGGSSYLVGEMGPEIFTPAAGGGHITPNKSLGGSNITINVNAGMGANGAQIGEQIVTAIKRYERTSGPVFASA